MHGGGCIGTTVNIILRHLHAPAIVSSNDQFQCGVIVLCCAVRDILTDVGTNTVFCLRAVVVSYALCYHRYCYDTIVIVIIVISLLLSTDVARTFD